MPSRLLLTLALLLAATCCGGCLKRTISVTTEPPALVWINDVECGAHAASRPTSPSTATYDVARPARGLRTASLRKAEAETPIEEQPGIDVLGEIAPVRFHDIVRWNWKLTPLVERTQPVQETESDLLSRAYDLRTRQSPIWTTGHPLEEPEPTTGGKPPPPEPEPQHGKKPAHQ